MIILSEIFSRLIFPSQNWDKLLLSGIFLTTFPLRFYLKSLIITIMFRKWWECFKKKLPKEQRRFRAPKNTGFYRFLFRPITMYTTYLPFMKMYLILRQK